MAKRSNTNGIPPKDRNCSLTGEQLAYKLQVLINKDFPITGKPRTDGANLRNLIEDTLAKEKIELAEADSYVTIPYKKKGIPKTIKYLAESFIVTTGKSYNLQIWNRIPNSRHLLVKYKNGEVIRCQDIYCILVKINVKLQKIDGIIVALPKYIERKFGKFGVPTIKFQAIISVKTRDSIISSATKSIVMADTENMKSLLGVPDDATLTSIASTPIPKQILPIEEIANRTIDKLIGIKLDSMDTKNRGQALERKVANLLGYSEESTLVGGYPDIYNQALEVKVQDSPTIDLGKETPVNPISIFDNLPITTEDVRYLVALTNSTTSVIEGIILAPGKEMENIFTMVNGTSFKCQRSIPMNFFEEHKGQSVFNP